MIDPDVKRELDRLLQGGTTAAGTFTLATDGISTTTTINKTGVSSNSVILVQAYSALALNADIHRIVPAVDRFVVTHPASTSTRTFRYVFLSGIAT